MTACGQTATTTTTTQQNTYKAGTYTAIKVLEQAETPGIADGALENMLTKIVEAQSLAVDCVTGATVTSDAILAAVEDCVAQAGGNVEQLKVAQATENTGEVEEVSTDVVVIDAGTLAGGMFAADSKMQQETGATVDKEWLYEEYMKASEG